MNLFSVFSRLDQLKFIQGIEQELQKRKISSNFGLLIGLLGAAYQVIVLFIHPDQLSSLLLTFPANVGIFALGLGLFLYFLLRKTNFLLKEAGEPFKYTFWTESFQSVSGHATGFHTQELPDFLHHDLNERLVERIKRLSLLNEDLNDDIAQASHIHISGHFLIRQDNQQLLIQLMPQVRIGPPSRPQHLTEPVKYYLPFSPVAQDQILKLSDLDYKKIVERVYARIASEIYKQIKNDLDEKINLFPSRNLKAIALYNEAEDFARSNTIDAYDYAIDLYQQSLAYFDMSIRGWANKFQRRMPWFLAGVKYNHIWAKTQIGYAKCLIYRRQISALSGRYKNPLFEIPDNLYQVINRLVELYNKLNRKKWQLNPVKQVQGEIIPYATLYFSENDFKDLSQFIAGLAHPNGNPLHDHLCKLLRIDQSAPPEPKMFLQKLNKIIQDQHFIKPDLTNLPFSYRVREKLDYLMHADDGPHLKMLVMITNRIMLEELYPEDIINNYDKVTEEMRRKNRQFATMASLTYRDTFLHKVLYPDSPLFVNNKKILFDAYVVMGLCHYYLDLPLKAKIFLEDAKSIAPSFSERNPLYLLAEAEVEPSLNKKIPLLVKATELAPEFEIAQYLLAHSYELLFRKNDEIIPERAESVIRRYDVVLALNPGNIASLLAQGNLLWLISRFEEAESKFLQGEEVKTTVQQTFIGELLYGRARVAAEQGHINDSYDAYLEAISADPGVAAFNTNLSRKIILNPYYEHIGPNMLKRFLRFKNNVQGKIYGEKEFSDDDVSHWDSFIQVLSERSTPPGIDLFQMFDPYLQQMLNQYQNRPLNFIKFQLKKQIINQLNHLIRQPKYQSDFQDLWQKLPNQDKEQLAPYNQENRRYYFNKAILEKLFNGLIRADVQAELRSEGKAYPSSTCQYVTSMVLNDYANACFNFFLHFGYSKGNRMVEAIENYEKALKLVPDNKVTMYNLSHAYQEKFGDYKIQQQLDLLRSAQSGTFWQPATVSYIRCRLRSFDILQKTLTRRKEQHLTRIEQAKQEAALQKQPKERKRQVDQENISGKKYRLGLSQEAVPSDDFRNKKSRQVVGQEEVSAMEFSGTAGKKFLWSDETERSQLRQMVFDAEQEQIKSTWNIINEARSEIAKIETDLANLPLNKKSFIETEIHQVIEKTKISSLFESFSYQSSETQIEHQLLDLVEQIETDRLDESDLEALLVWAEVIMYGYDEPLIRNVSQQLCNLIRKKYLIGFFDIQAILRDGYKQQIMQLVELKWQEGQDLQVIHQEVPFREFKKHISLFDQLMAREIDHYRQKYRDYHVYNTIQNLDLQLELARFWFAKDDFEQALAVLNQMEGHDSPDQVKILILKGEIYMKQSKIKQAIDTFKQLIKLAPDESLGYYNLAKAYGLDRNYPRAILNAERAVQLDLMVEEYYVELATFYKNSNKNYLAEIALKQALQLNRNNHSLWHQLGNLYHEQTRYYEAIKCYRKALRLKPQSSNYYFSLGATYKALFKYNEAEKAYQNALNKEEKDLIYFELGNLGFLKKEYGSAKKYYEQAYKLQPQNVEYLSHLVRSLENCEETIKARELLDQVMEKYKLRDTFLDHLGMAFYRLADDAKAIRCYEEAIKVTDKNPKYFSHLALAAMGADNFNLARESINIALALDPDNITYLGYSGRIYINLKDYDKAIEIYTHIIMLNPEPAEYKVKIVGLFDLTNQVKKADLEIKKAISYDPKNGAYMNELGNAYQKISYFTQALECYNHATRLDPVNGLYHYNLSQASLELKKYEQAISAVQMALLYNPDKSTYYNHYGNILYKQKAYEKAIKQYIKAASLEPFNTVYYSNLGLMYANINKQHPDPKMFDKAVYYYEKAYLMNPFQAQYADNMAILCNDQGDHRKAIKYALRAIQLEPENAAYQAEMGLAYHKLNLYTESAEWYLKAASLKPEFGSYWNNAGLAFYYNKAYDEAIESYRKAIEAEPEYAVYFQNIALAYKDQMKYDLALQWYFKALDTQPEQPSRIYNYIGLIYYDQKELPEAIKWYEKAVKKAPEEHIYLANLGLAHREEGNLEQAVAYFQSALKKDPQNDIYLHELGKAFLENGEGENALHYLARAVELKPDNATLVFDLGRAYLTNKEMASGIEQLQKAISLKSSEIDFYLALSQAFRQIDQWDQAETTLRKIMKTYPGNRTVTCELGQLKLALNDSAAAQEIFREGLMYNPDDPELLVGLMNAFMADQQTEEAENIFLDTLNTHQSDCNYLYELGRALYPSHPQKAATCFGKIQQDCAQEHQLLIEIGRLYGLDHEFTAAVAFLNDAIQAEFPDYQVYMFLVRSYLALDLKEQEEKVFQEALARFSHKHSRLYRMGKYFKEEKLYDHALICFKRALQIDPANKVYVLELFRIFLLEDYQLQAEAFLRSLMSTVNAGNTLFDLAELFFAEKMNDFAILCYKLALELDPGNHLYWAYLIDTFIQDHKQEKADQLLQGLLNDPDQILTFTYKLSVTFFSLKQYRYALQSAKKAYQLAPGNIEVLEILAKIYFYCRMYRESAEVYLNIMRLSDQKVYQDNFHLAISYIKDELQKNEILAKAGLAVKS
ncbi:MAG: tetratricopeptide repeat protein [Candidatus Cyclobacteriaceae bacterium M3_2C_046]